MNSPLLQLPLGYSVSSDIISGLKHQVLWPNQSSLLKASENEDGQDKNLEESSECLAVVPSVPSQLPHAQGAEVQQPDVSEMMDAEGMEDVKMDVEDANMGIEQRHGNEFGETMVNKGLHQWQQQYCLVPQFPQNTHAPIVWFC